MVSDRVTIRAVLDLFEVDGSDFYHNEPNNYGAIDLKLFTGKGSPRKYRGTPLMGRYEGKNGVLEVRETGRYKLNDKLVDRIVEMIEERSK